MKGSTLISALLICLMAILFLTGCSEVREEDEMELQRLAQIEVYSKGGDLINIITDEDILYQFSHLESMSGLDDSGIFDDMDSSQDGLADRVDETAVLYRMVSYKTPAAVLNDGKLEKETEITIYEDSDIVKEQIMPEAVKGMNVLEEYLTFYNLVSEEDKEFLLKLVN